MSEESDSERARAILKSVNGQRRPRPDKRHPSAAVRRFKVTYVYRAAPGRLGVISHIQDGATSRTVYQDFCRLREHDGLLDFRLEEPDEVLGVPAGALAAFPARNVYQVFIEEVKEA